MELTRADGSHTMQFRDGDETGTATAAAMAKLAVHAEEYQDKHATIDVNRAPRLLNHCIAHVTIHTLRTCRPRKRTRGHPRLRPEKNQYRQLQQSPAYAWYTHFTQRRSHTLIHLVAIWNANLHRCGRKGGSRSNAKLTLRSGFSHAELHLKFNE
jgi:hypothetical protein